MMLETEIAAFVSILVNATEDGKNNFLFYSTTIRFESLLVAGAENCDNLISSTENVRYTTLPLVELSISIGRIRDIRKPNQDTGNQDDLILIRLLIKLSDQSSPKECHCNVNNVSTSAK